MCPYRNNKDKGMNNPDKKVIEKAIEGFATKEEAREVANWFSASAEGQSYLSELINRDAQRVEKDEFEITISQEQSRNILSQINMQIQRKHTQRLVLRVAAVLIPFVFLMGLAFYTNSQVDLFGGSTYAEVYVPKGQQQHIIFQDGSEVFLNADTKLKYPTKFGIKNRKVFLSGEGYFVIAKNKKRPFVVQLNNTDVTVLGTMFNVKAYQEDNEMKITLDKGLIVFNSPKNSYRLQPGQLAIYDKKSGNCSILSQSNSVEESSWKNNVIMFKDTPLSEVLKVLNRKFNIKFNVKNVSSITYSYTLTTYQTSLDKVLDELETISPVRFTVQKDSVNVFLK